METYLPESFLEHYGVKGMRWGVRKDDTSRTEKRAAKRQKEAIYWKKQAEKEQYKRENFIFSERGIKASYAKQSVYEQNAKDVGEQKKGLTPRQKKRLKGAAVAAGIVLAYSTYRMAESGQLNQQIMKGKQVIQGRKTPFLRREGLANPNFSAKEIESKVVSHINPNYNAIGAKMNCRRCTYAYELRRRGYDVAATRTTTGTGQNVWGFRNAIDTAGKNTGTNLSVRQALLRLRPSSKTAQEVTKLNPSLGGAKYVSSSTNLFFDLGLSQERARGEVGVVWKGGGGHSMAWEKINGVVHIFDCQTGKTYTEGSREATKLLSNVASASWTRLDNIDLDLDFLTRWIKDAG